MVPLEHEYRSARRLQPPRAERVSPLASLPVPDRRVSPEGMGPAGDDDRNGADPFPAGAFWRSHPDVPRPCARGRVIDFHTFWSDVMADTIALFARTVKEATGGRKVVGAFYGYTFEFTELAEDAGHLALGRLTCSPDVDFIMAPSSYFNRNLPGSPYFRFPVASLRLHGKVAWNDFDQVSYKYFDKLREDPGLKQWEYQMGLTKTAEEFVWMNRREVGMGLTQGVQSANFDIHGGYYEDPVILAGVAQLNRIRTQATRKDQRASAAEILVLVDEESEHYLSFRNPVTTRLLRRRSRRWISSAPTMPCCSRTLQWPTRDNTSSCWSSTPRSSTKTNAACSAARWLAAARPCSGSTPRAT